MEILFLTTVLPHGRVAGGEIGAHDVIDGLSAAGHGVTVVGYRRAGEARKPPADWIEVAQRPIETEEAGRLRVAVWMCSALGRRLPYSSTKYRSRAYVRTVRSLLASRRFELAVVDHAQVGWIRPQLERAHLPFVLSAHNVEQRLYAGQADEARGLRRWVLRREARLIGAMEAALARQGRATWPHSDADAPAFARLGAVHPIPVHSRFTGPAVDVKKRCDVALMGTWTWDSTRAALAWFLDSVHPRLPPGLTVEIAGRGGDWLDGSFPGVRYRGFVPDALEFLAAARVVAVPGVGATGVQVKTLDAIASGAQVVATPAAARDLASPPSSLHVAAGGEEFAAELGRLAAAPESLTPSEDGLRWTGRRRERFQKAVAAAAAAAVTEPEP
jgi:hypothetical protein